MTQTTARVASLAHFQVPLSMSYNLGIKRFHPQWRTSNDLKHALRIILHLCKQVSYILAWFAAFLPSRVCSDGYWVAIVLTSLKQHDFYRAIMASNGHDKSISRTFVHEKNICEATFKKQKQQNS